MHWSSLRKTTVVNFPQLYSFVITVEFIFLLRVRGFRLPQQYFTINFRSILDSFSFIAVLMNFRCYNDYCGNILRVHSLQGRCVLRTFQQNYPQRYSLKTDYALQYKNEGIEKKITPIVFHHTKLRRVSKFQCSSSNKNENFSHLKLCIYS